MSTTLTLDDLNAKFKQLKSLVEAPRVRLIYLSDYFSDLKSQVDLAFVKKSHLVVDESILTKLNSSWLEIIAQIEQFESECLNYNRKVKKPSESNENLRVIDSKLHSLSQIDLSQQNELVEEINQLIYDEMFQIEKSMFLNRSMMFLDAEKCQDKSLLGKLNLETTTGRLVYIKNEYFGSNGIEYLKSNDSSNEKVTNEILKCKELKNCLKKLTANHLEETQLNLNNLTKINLSNSRLKVVNSSVFKGLTNLQVINLSNNLLTHLSSDLFDGLYNLKSLYLYENQLTRLDSNLFKDLTKLSILMISNNNLTHLEPSVFKSLNNLTELSLANNELEYVHSNAFSDLSRLNEIRLSGNKLSSIDSNIFAGLTKLKEIYLDSNHLEKLDSNVFANLEYLCFINLARNKLGNLDENLFKGLKRIVRIILAQNEHLIVDKNLFKKYPINW